MGAVLSTPDERYIIVRGRLWRKSNPDLPESERERLVHELMTARRAVRDGKRAGDEAALTAAHAAVDAAKHALGERGPVWWTDGTPDENRHMARNSSYAEWYASLDQDAEAAARDAR
jgi:hypothetical protein